MEDDRLRRIEEAQRRMEEAIDNMAEDFYGPHRPGVAGGGRDHTKGVKGMVEDLWNKGANGGPGLQAKWTVGQKATVISVLGASVVSAIATVLG